MSFVAGNVIALLPVWIVLGDSAAMPVASCVTKFRDEFKQHLAHGGCPFGADSSLDRLFAPVDQHVHPAVPA